MYIKPRYVLCCIFILYATAGCGEGYRKTTLTVLETAQKTDDSVVYDLATIAKSQAILVAKSQIEAGEDIEKVLGQLAQKFEDIGWLEMQHAAAKSLNGHAWIYVASRQPWVTKAYEDMKGALSNAGNLDALPPSSREMIEIEAQKARDLLEKHKELLDEANKRQKQLQEEREMLDQPSNNFGKEQEKHNPPV